MYKSHQYAILYASSWGPVEHASAVVLHLSLLKVKVLCLVVGNPNLKLPVLLLVCWLVCRPANSFQLEWKHVLTHIDMYIDQYPGRRSIYEGFVQFMFKGCFICATLFS